MLTQSDSIKTTQHVFIYTAVTYRGWVREKKPMVRLSHHNTEPDVLQMLLFTGGLHKPGSMNEENPTCWPESASETWKLSYTSQARAPPITAAETRSSFLTGSSEDATDTGRTCCFQRTRLDLSQQAAYYGPTVLRVRSSAICTRINQGKQNWKKSVIMHNRKHHSHYYSQRGKK